MTTPCQGGPAEWNDFVLDTFPVFNAVDSDQSRNFTSVRQAAKSVELAGERKRNGMVVEIVAADAAISHCNQMAMETTDNGDQIATVLHGIGIGCCFSFGFVGTVGNGDGHSSFPGVKLAQEEGPVHQLDNDQLAVKPASLAHFSDVPKQTLRSGGGNTFQRIWFCSMGEL